MFFQGVLEFGLGEFNLVWLSLGAISGFICISTGQMYRFI